MLKNLHEQALTIDWLPGRELVFEAIRCYEASAYRAAIITTWIAVSADLIEKLREMASGSDARASELVNSLETLQETVKSDTAAIKGLLEFERRLIEFYRDDFQFFGFQEYIEMDRLRQDRHRCAHPSYDISDSFYQPTAEAARNHIVNAIDLVLGRSPTSGKAALERLLILVQSKNFPDDPNAILIRLKGSELGKARDSLVRAFVDAMVYKSAEATDFGINGVGALSAAIEMYKSVALPRAVYQINRIIPRLKDDDLWIVPYMLFIIDEIRPEIDLANRATLNKWILNEEGLIAGRSVDLACSIDWMYESAALKASYLTLEQIADIKTQPSPPLLDRAVAIFCAVTDWTEANSVAEKIIIPNVPRLTKQHIDLILDAATNGSADLQGSHGFRRFVNRVYQEKPISNESMTVALKDRSLDFYVGEDQAK